MKYGMSYLSIAKLQRCNCWSLGMKKKFHTTFYLTYRGYPAKRALSAMRVSMAGRSLLAGYHQYDYLSMQGLNLIHVSKRGHRHYSEVIWAARFFMSLATPLFIQQLVHTSLGPHGSTEAVTWISNHKHCFMWDMITHPCPKLPQG